MPITNEYVELPLGDIWIDRDSRQRKEVSTKGLIDSIKARGVLQPIIIDKGPGAPPYRLIAGERRYTACLQLGLPTIPCRFLSDLDPIEAQIIELEENIKRENLTWQDTVCGVARIHQLYCSLEPTWTQGETGETIGLSPGIISQFLRIHANLSDERIAKASTAREAYNTIARRDNRAAGEALQEMLEAGESPAPAPVPVELDELLVLEKETGPVREYIPVPVQVPVPAAPALLDPAKSILHESFLHWAPKYSGKKFNLIHCDFPYGVNLFDGPNGGGRDSTSYEDTSDVYYRLLVCLCDNLDKLMSVSGHLLFWYSEKHRSKTLEIFAKHAPGLVFQPFPLIWVKSDNVGIASDVKRSPRHIYETCLMASRGGRQIVRVVADAYSAPTDKRYHVSTKPEPVLKHFFTMLVDEHTSLLDPTCGSGSALRAAEAMGAQHVLGLEIDENTCGTARMALRHARTLGRMKV